MTTTLASKGLLLFQGSSFDNSPIVPSFSHRIGEAGNDILVVEGQPIFRSGTFRDSYGDTSTWEALHIEMMITNFNHLKSTGIFADVPVRSTHPGFLSNSTEEMIGYIVNLRSATASSPVDGAVYSYLLADYEILDPAAAQKIESRLWRNRSSEIGMYISNNDTEFWPVLMGFAYVDIPAVEALNFSKSKDDPRLIFEANDGTSMSNSENNDTNIETSASVASVDPIFPVSPTTASLPEPTSSDVEPVDDEVGNDDGATEEAARVEETAQVEEIDPADGDNTSAESGSTVLASRSSLGMMVYGSRVTDPAVLQDHITRLERFEAESRTKERMDFISGLANRNVILAGQRADYEKFAARLDDAAWEEFKSLLSGAGQHPVLGLHQASDWQTAGNGDTIQFTDEELNIAEEIVKNHQRARMPQGKIELTDSYKKLKKAGRV